MSGESGEVEDEEGQERGAVIPTSAIALTTQAEGDCKLAVSSKAASN